MNQLDKILERIEDSNINKLKSEEIFPEYLEAKENLLKKMLTLSSIIERLEDEQLKSLDMNRSSF